MLKGFKEFIMKGNVVDLAVAVVIAGAFGQVISAFVDGILMPLVARLFSAQDLEGLVWEGFQYGAVIAAIINFIMVAAAVYFVIVVPMNKMIERRNQRLGIETPDPDAPSEDVALLTEIRDLLRTK